eukprot:6214810-Pleurochrysis_carterae.AAC.1
MTACQPWRRRKWAVVAATFACSPTTLKKKKAKAQRVPTLSSRGTALDSACGSARAPEGTKSAESASAGLDSPEVAILAHKPAASRNITSG